jgi:UDP-N-acetylglucosamine 2-epimerase (non-hydrolysing)
MEKCYFVLTDSGGIQEEAPALGKPVLVMRDVTERQEGVDAGTAKLVGTKTEALVLSMRGLLENNTSYSMMANAVNPYGDGTTSKRIVEILIKTL